MLLIVVTTIGSLALAAHGWPGSALAAWTVLGMALVSGGSSAVNHWYDRDIDALMERTSARPVASGRVGAGRRARASASCSPAAGVAVLALPGALAGGRLGARRLPLLRRRLHRVAQAPHAAEHRHRRRGRAVPPLAAWAAVHGSVSATAVALFAIVFLWTPPHFWALALLSTRTTRAPACPCCRRCAARAPARSRSSSTRCSCPWHHSCRSPWGRSGWLYAAVAAVLGARFVWLAAKLLRAPDDRTVARRMFLYSLLYLALLFVAMGVDSAL